MGELEVQWNTEFEAELSRRRVFVKEGSAAFNHFAFFKSKPRARRMSDESMMIGLHGEHLIHQLILCIFVF